MDFDVTNGIKSTDAGESQLDLRARKASEFYRERLVAQVRFLSLVLEDIYELTDPRSEMPGQDLQMIRIKTQVALRAVVQSGLLS